MPKLISFFFASSTLSAPRSREGVESGYSSLEKARSDAEDLQTGSNQDYRCEFLTSVPTLQLHFVTQA